MRKAFIVPLLLLFLVSTSDAKKQNTIRGLRHASYKNHTRVVIDLKGPVEYTQNRLSNPERIYFDLKDCTLSTKSDAQLKIDDKILKSVRLSQFDKETARVVFDIRNKKTFTAFVLEHPYRLVVDVYAPDSEAPARKKDKKHKKVLVQKSLQEIKRIVLDPGHGGKDPGAIGPRGLKEKDITLDVAKNLGAILKKKYGVEIIYTRTKDVFVPLNERTELANSKKADLFISIHTNASKSRKMKGLETYFLNWTNDREAIRVAARENKISIKNMQKMQNDLQFILQDLARKSKNEESMRLAHSVQNSMVSSLKKNYRGVNDLGVKYALFYVLVGAEMPSALVEISFISNKEEEKRLASRKYKKRIAEAIAKGINSYITQATLIVSPFDEGSGEILSADAEGSEERPLTPFIPNHDVLSHRILSSRDAL